MPSNSIGSPNVFLGSYQCSQPASPTGHHTLSTTHHHHNSHHSNHSSNNSTATTPPPQSPPHSVSNSVRNQANSSRYKTELCRPYEENGVCKYGDKCQFAHGDKELRTLQRHPKYKTELCRTFHTTGFCPYGPRCHFIHNSEESKQHIINTLKANLPRSQLNGLNLDIDENMDDSDLLFYIFKNLPKKLYL